MPARFLTSSSPTLSGWNEPGQRRRLTPTFTKTIHDDMWTAREPSKMQSSRVCLETSTPRCEVVLISSLHVCQRRRAYANSLRLQDANSGLVLGAPGRRARGDLF